MHQILFIGSYHFTLPPAIYEDVYFFTEYVIGKKYLIIVIFLFIVYHELGWAFFVRLKNFFISCICIFSVKYLLVSIAPFFLCCCLLPHFFIRCLCIRDITVCYLISKCFSQLKIFHFSLIMSFFKHSVFNEKANCTYHCSLLLLLEIMS